MVWVDVTLSLGSASLSRTSTDAPARLRRIARDAPTHRAPTIMASYFGALIRRLFLAVYVVGGGQIVRLPIATWVALAQQASKVDEEGAQGHKALVWLIRFFVFSL